MIVSDSAGIAVSEKPDSISWSDIASLVNEAHSSNRQNGVDIRNAHMSGEELRNSIGQDGRCFVALSDGKLVGTCSVAFKNLNSWYSHERSAYLTLAAVHPEYKGIGVFKMLSETRMMYIKEAGVNVVFMNIAENNVTRRRIASKEGFQQVAIRFNSYNPHNYVTYCLWLTQKPCSDLMIRMHYLKSLAVIKVKAIKRKK